MRWHGRSSTRIEADDAEAVDPQGSATPSTTVSRCLADPSSWRQALAVDWDELLDRQSGVVSRRQALAYGVTDSALDARVRRGRWRRLHFDVRDVERAHELPRGVRQHVVRRGGGVLYEDVRYRRYRTVVELDGRVGHADGARWRDMRRDNASIVDGDVTLRYGTADVSERPCKAAVQLARVLRARGWEGFPRPCGPSRDVVEDFPLPAMEILHKAKRGDRQEGGAAPRGIRLSCRLTPAFPPPLP